MDVSSPVGPTTTTLSIRLPSATPVASRSAWIRSARSHNRYALTTSETSAIPPVLRARQAPASSRQEHHRRAATTSLTRPVRESLDGVAFRERRRGKSVADRCIGCWRWARTPVSTPLVGMAASRRRGLKCSAIRRATCDGSRHQGRPGTQPRQKRPRGLARRVREGPGGARDRRADQGRRGCRSVRVGHRTTSSVSIASRRIRARARRRKIREPSLPCSRRTWPRDVFARVPTSTILSIRMPMLESYV